MTDFFDLCKAAMCSGLVGEVYPELESVWMRLDDEYNFTIRYYVDREPEEYDYESISSVESGFDAALSLSQSDKIRSYRR